MKKLLVTIVACLFVLGMATTAKAVVLNPGDINIAATGAASPGGVLQVPALVIPFSGLDAGNNVLYTGTLTQWVRLNGTGLLFEYQFTNNAGSANAITQVALLNFGNFSTNADANPLLADPFPDGMNRSAGVGTTVTYSYLINSVDPTQTSNLLWIQTNSQFIGSGTTQLLGGGVASLLTYGPTVPEPASAMLLGMGLLGLASSVIRRKFMA